MRKLAPFFIMQKDINYIYAFLKAKSADELQEMMLQNNISKKAYHQYQIVYSGSNWYAWYETKLDDLIVEKLNGKRQRSRVK